MEFALKSKGHYPIVGLMAEVSFVALRPYFKADPQRAMFSTASGRPFIDRGNLDIRRSGIVALVPSMLLDGVASMNVHHNVFHLTLHVVMLSEIKLLFFRVV